MSDAKVVTKKSNWRNHLKGTLINVTIIILAFVSAIGLFAVYRNYETEKEKNSIIPRAKDAFTKGDYSESINLFQTAEGYFPDNIEVKEYLGELSYYKGKTADTINYLEFVKSKQDLTLNDISYLGNSYIAQEKTDKAIELWSNAKELKPEDTYKLANLYLDQKLTDKYFAELKKIKDYQEPLIYLQVQEPSLANILTNIDKATNSKQLSSKSIDIDLFKSQITEAKKQYDFNKKDYSELIKLAAFANLGQCEIIDPQITALKTTLANQKIPTYQVEFLQGKCFNQEQKADEAIPLIQNAINSEKSNLEYREELAKSYFLKKDYDNLKKTYDEIFVIKKTADLYQNYAAYLYKLNKKEESIENYKNAFKIAEDSEQQEEIATIIVQVEFLDNKSLEICSNEDIINAITYDTENTYLLKSTCDIANSKDINTTAEVPTLDINYIQALKSKDIIAIQKVLDRDIDAYITNYYNTVGVKLMN